MGAFKKILGHWIISFLPKDLQNSNSRSLFYKARLLVICSFVTSLFFAFTSSLLYLINSKASFTALFSSVFFFLIPFFLKKTKNFRLIVSMIPTLILLFLPYFIYGDGNPEIKSQLNIWYSAIPLIAFYFLGNRSGIFFSFIGLVEQLVFLYIHYTQLTILQTSMTIPQSIFYEMGNIGLFTLVSLFCWQYELLTLNSKDALNSSREKTLAANRAKDIFWANIGHEIRTPLNGILGMTNLLLESRLNGDQKELLGIIKDSSENLNIILNDVFDYSKLETGELEISKRPFHLRDTLDLILDLFQHKAEEKNIKLSYFIDNDVPVGILSDEQRIKQILANIISNAIKFTDHGHIKIIVEKSGKKNTIKFLVEDTGIGIPNNKINLLFKPFSQIDSSSVRNYGGTGLGLVICKNLVEILGGKISVESMYGKGSIFSFTIEALSVQVKSHQTIDITPITDGQTIMSKEVYLRILVTEDNIVNQKLILSLLKMSGHHADLANNGQEALDKLEQNQYDLIFMDIQMPIMDGITATKEIIKRYPKDRPKIVAVTANVLQEDKNRCFEAGMDDFMAKPINNNILLSVLGRYSKQIQEIKDINLPDSKESHPLLLKQKHFPVDYQGHYESFNAQELLKNFSGDMIVIEIILDQFLIKYPDDINLLEEAIALEDLEVIERAGHSFKGTLSSFYSKEGVSLAIKMEKAGKNGNIEAAAKVLKELKNLTTQLEKDLNDFIKDYKSAA